MPNLWIYPVILHFDGNNRLTMLFFHIELASFTVTPPRHDEAQDIEGGI
jgi:hypothetical protein